ncbi:MAG: exodeoxyribonuclease V subunit gamma [Deltaproteobacteria bacterium]|nr:exodeoxyribonuclease V subunit gamma [Deltaproteobacteria bacterium]
MAGLNVYTANYLEVLLDGLAALLREPLSQPLAREIVVVQSRGMERWISLELARRLGICANIRFPFPRAFVYEMFTAVLSDKPPAEAFDPEVAAWRILGLLPGCMERPAFADLRCYLGDDDAALERKRFQLARRIAEVFDQYLIYRPEMILGWEGGEAADAEAPWQAELWRGLVSRGQGDHPAALFQAFRKRIGETDLSESNLPERVSLFGISSLPRFYMECLAALSSRIPVNLFLMNPSRQFWGEIRSGREIGRIFERLGRYGDGADGEDALYLEEGNSLLASLGVQGREFFSFIAETACEQREDFTDPGDGTLLHCIQSDILDLRDRGADGTPKKTLFPRDRSVQVHVCHSPMREVEVLRDNLLAFFDQNPELLPGDVAVMMPDIDAYAPLIQAVFDVPEGEPEGGKGIRIPFSIADRALRSENGIAAALIRILELAGSRLGAPEVLELLDVPSLRAAFDIDEQALERIAGWIEEARIRWGKSERDLQALGLPMAGENTWEAGLDRLLLGYALPGDGERLFMGILPFDGIGGSDGPVLGSFLEFRDDLFGVLDGLAAPRTLSAWSGCLRAIVERFFRSLTSDDEEGRLVLYRLLTRLEEMQERSGFEDVVNLDVIQAWLVQSLDLEGFGQGFLTGGVTFCALLPMRSIPFRILCLLGMNSDIFPRRDRSFGFDLIAKHPRPSDRSRRGDDRYLFLEALLSAREKLIISYVGRSLKDNSPMPPSVVVSELLDYIDRGFALPSTGDSEAPPGTDRMASDGPDRKSDREGVLGWVITEHRLQAFSPAYFQGDERLFSYSEENRRAAAALIDRRPHSPVFLDVPLPETDGGDNTLNVEDLLQFFSHPARFFIRRRLLFSLREDGDEMKDTEDFHVEGLERYGLEQVMVQREIEGRDFRAFYPAARASGRLPQGVVGRCHYHRLGAGVRSFAAAVRRHLEGGALPPMPVDIEVAGFRILGSIDNLYGTGRVSFRHARLKPRDHLRAWICHLLLNLLPESPCSRISVLLGRDGSFRYEPLGEAPAILERLLEHYRDGLCRPLPFLPESSWAYMDAVFLKGKSPQEGLKAARSVWENAFGRSESADPYLGLCFGKADPLAGDEFQGLAGSILGPLLDHRKTYEEG